MHTHYTYHNSHRNAGDRKQTSYTHSQYASALKLQLLHPFVCACVPHSAQESLFLIVNRVHCARTPSVMRCVCGIGVETLENTITNQTHKARTIERPTRPLEV